MGDSYVGFTLAGSSDSGKTSIWMVTSPDRTIMLGQIKWHAPWRKYVFYPSMDTLFDVKCLTEIADFLTAEMAKRHESPK